MPVLVIGVVVAAVWYAIGSVHQSDTTGGVPAAATVTYSCSGSGDVEITYGPEGSQLSATGLPFEHTDTITGAPLFVVVTAQLQGYGSVSCTTTVVPGGGAPPVSQQGSAEDGYNIATAQVCAASDGGWQPC